MIIQQVMRDLQQPCVDRIYRGVDSHRIPFELQEVFSGLPVGCRHEARQLGNQELNVILVKLYGHFTELCRESW